MFRKNDDKRDAGLTVPDNISITADLHYGPDPEQVLDQTQRIEKLFGRMRKYKEKGEIYENRTLDIDILQAFKMEVADNIPDKGGDKRVRWSEIKIDTPKLTIPHPQIGTRPFVSVLLDKLKK